MIGTTGTFFYPGPTEVRAEVLQAMTRPMIPHRGAEFREMFARLQAGLRALLGTDQPVFVSSSSATGLMEAAVRAAPPGPMLCVVNGAFSERFAALAAACGRELERYEVGWGTAPQPAAIDQQLTAARAAGRPFATMTLVHVETSTGVMCDVEAIAAIARRHDVRCVVDAVTSVGGAGVHADRWALDFLLTGSQKALALPPGLAFGVASPAFLEGASHAPARGLYLDLVEMSRSLARDETPNTPAIPLLYALDVQLAAIEAEGLSARWERHAEMAALTHAWADGWSGRSDGAIHVLAPEGVRAPTVTALTLPAGVAATDVVRAVAARGFTIGTGYGQLRDRTMRIGHMGDHRPDQVARCLAACDAALEQLLVGAG